MEIDEIIKKQLENVMDTSSLNAISDKYTIEDILEKTLNGENLFDPQIIISNLKDLFFLEITKSISCGLEIVCVCLLIGLVQNMQTSLEKNGSGLIARTICVISIVGVTVVNFTQSYQLAHETLTKLCSTMEILIPVLVGLLLAMGKLVSGSVLNPLLLSLIAIFQILIKKIVLPGLFFSNIIGLFNCLSEKDYVNQLSTFINKFSMFFMGIILTLMSGIITIQGLISSSSDSLVMGTAKYSLNAFIPIVGGFTSDTIEVFLTCMQTIKSVVGVFGIIVVVTVMVAPIIKIFSIGFVYKCTSILIEPIADLKISKSLSNVSTCLFSLCAVIFFSSLLFIIFIAAIMSGLN